MRLAFATVHDPRDIRRGSGTWYHLAREIERQGHSVHYCASVETIVARPTALLQRVSRRMGRRHVTFLDPFTARLRATDVVRQVRTTDVEVLLTNDFGIGAYTAHRVPTVIYTDVMIPREAPRGIPPESRLARMSPLSAWLAKHTIRKGLREARLCVFPAQWSADQARTHAVPKRPYGVVPFGANVPDPGPAVAAERTAVADGVRLLFVGKDWGRKGGVIAVETLQVLHERGVSSELDVVGYSGEDAARPGVRLHGLLDKADERGEALLDSLYRCADVFILPSRSEGSVISALEAAAYGLPCVAYDVEGVASAVRDDISGALLPLESGADGFADVIERWARNPQEYRRLVLGARHHYETTANWTTAVKALMAKIEEAIEGPAT